MHSLKADVGEGEIYPVHSRSPTAPEEPHGGTRGAGVVLLRAQAASQQGGKGIFSMSVLSS